jgi:predicted RNA-binding Zn-ribbon protein involved in translation (DUF1610 family)
MRMDDSTDELLTDEHPCPNCGNRTLTERGVTVRYNDGTEGRTTSLGCINCGWREKDDE